MAKIMISATADADVEDILDYLADEAGISTVVKYERSFDELYEHLALYPESCPRRPRLDPAARLGIVSPYVVLYTYVPVDDTVSIVRVIHGRRRITKKLFHEKKK